MLTAKVGLECFEHRGLGPSGPVRMWGKAGGKVFSENSHNWHSWFCPPLSSPWRLHVSLGGFLLRCALAIRCGGCSFGDCNQGVGQKTEAVFVAARLPWGFQVVSAERRGACCKGGSAQGSSRQFCESCLFCW